MWAFWKKKSECETKPKRIAWDKEFCIKGAARYGSYSAFFLSKSDKDWASINKNMTWDGLIWTVLNVTKESAERNVKDYNDEGTESDTGSGTRDRPDTDGSDA